MANLNAKWNGSCRKLSSGKLQLPAVQRWVSERFCQVDGNRPQGTDTLSRPGRTCPSPTLGSGGDGRGFPCPVRPGTQDPETWSGDQVGLDIERVVDGGVAGKEPLGRGSGLELLLLSLPAPDQQVRVSCDVGARSVAWRTGQRSLRTLILQAEPLKFRDGWWAQPVTATR